MTVRRLLVALLVALMPVGVSAAPIFESIPMEEAAPRMAEPQHPLIVDVREPAEYAAGHVPGALNVPLKTVAAWAGTQPKDRPMYVICHSGRRSLKAATELASLGFTQVTNVQGGILAWQERGLPVETPTATP
ncbi:MAG TPA: rhodanese-like domain-containing protein [Stenomitos sp.]